jgi:hypothetical protein
VIDYWTPEGTPLPETDRMVLSTLVTLFFLPTLLLLLQRERAPASA